MNRYLIDTSVWVDYFHNNKLTVEFIENGFLKNNIFITGPVITELLQGIKTKNEKELLFDYIDAVPFIDVTFNDWKKAGILANELRRKGKTIPFTDTVIAAVSINNKLRLVTCDKHFSYINECRITKI